MICRMGIRLPHVCIAYSVDGRRSIDCPIVSSAGDRAACKRVWAWAVGRGIRLAMRDRHMGGAHMTR